MTIEAIEQLTTLDSCSVEELIPSTCTYTVGQVYPHSREGDIGTLCCYNLLTLGLCLILIHKPGNNKTQVYQYLSMLCVQC